MSGRERDAVNRAPEGVVTVERHDAVAVVRFANPRKRNALDPPLLAELTRVVEALPGEGVRAWVLTGDGDIFSSGFDISALPDTLPASDTASAPDATASGAAPTAAVPDPLTRLLDAIAAGPAPVVAALNGPAVGGGCELAVTCDLRVAHAGVSLRMPPVRLGLVYAAAGLRRFVALVGQAHARELFLTAAPVEAERALAWGLVDRLVSVDAVLPTALALAEEMARGAPLALAGTRRVLTLLEPPLDAAALAEARALHTRAWASDDAREARAAFREKRPPRFRGR